MDYDVNVVDVSVEIDEEEMPKILSVDGRKSLKSSDSEVIEPPFRCIRNEAEEDIQVLYIELEQRAMHIGKLQGENAMIVKERDETLEEYEEELKSLRLQNDGLAKENLETKQEVKILYKRIEENQAKDDVISNLNKKIYELENAMSQSEKIIKDLHNTNQLLTKALPESSEKPEEFIDNSCKDSLNELISEKNMLMKKIVELDDRYLESIKENEVLKNELVDMKVKYAESETQKDQIFNQFSERSRKKNN